MTSELELEPEGEGINKIVLKEMLQKFLSFFCTKTQGPKHVRLHSRTDQFKDISSLDFQQAKHTAGPNNFRG